MLADRVGIIDHGHIVAEGTPESLKAEIGRPSVEATPSDRADRDAVAEVLEPVRRRRPAPPGRGGGAAGQRRGPRGRRAGARRRRPAGRRPAAAPAVARRRLPGQDRPPAGADGRARGASRFEPRQPDVRDGPALGAADAAPAGDVHPADPVPARPDGDQRGRAGRRDADLPGFPTDNYLDFAIAFPFIQGALFASINAGSAVARDVETGFLNRLALTPMQRAAMLLGQLGGVLFVALAATFVYLVVGFAAGLHFEAGPFGVVVLIVLGAADRARVRVARGVHRAAHRAPARRCRASSRCCSCSCSCPRARSRAS